MGEMTFPRRRSFSVAVFLFGALALVASACTDRGARPPGQGRTSATPVPVVTSVSIAQSWASALLEGIERPRLVFDQVLLRAEPELTSDQARALAGAQLLIGWNGRYDRFAVESVRQHANDSVDVLLLDDATTPTLRWMVPTEATLMVERLADALAERYPTRADWVRQSATRLTQDIAQLDSQIDVVMADLPRHAVWIEDERLRPFVDRLGLPVAGVLRRAPREEISPTRLRDLRAVLAEEGPALLLAIDQPPRALIGDDDARSALPISVVIIDPMLAGNAGPNDYPLVMRRNVMLIAAALLGHTPSETPTQ